MAANGEVDLTFDPRLADHLAADRLYYKSTLWAKIDRVVAVLLVVLGSLATWAAGPRWWALIQRHSQAGVHERGGAERVSRPGGQQHAIFYRVSTRIIVYREGS